MTLSRYWISVWTFFFALGLSKMSICFQYLRIFVGKRTTLATRIILVLVVLCTTEAVIVMMFQCVPVAAFWNPDILQGRCVRHDAVYYFNASMNVFTDVALIALPVPALNQLHARKTQKIGLVIAFGMGGA
ncbi:hypothetical protein MPH_06503 [Macrophomina phaseolina MS6]|uniref:Rhodopsin domain-containing protein n=2 Tax=Macrophomina phaseolina TaxID=35725 RepID=K2S1A7_MACPH|nr:hypothetical protein MPH_06503 [Macrophomina phaseolina MS6]